jgi:large subunit ribosomal protein L4
MPKKIRFLALKTLLSAKLAEGKIRIIDSEKIEEPKTRIVGKIMKQFDEKNNILIITSYKPDSNFERAQENIPNLEQAHSNVNMFTLFKNSES